MDSTENPLTTVKSTGQVTAKVSEDGAEKQDQNGSGTVSTEPDVDPAVRRRAAEVLADVVLNDWTERDQRPMVLLMALCKLEAEGRGASSVGWDGIEVARAMARLGDGRAQSWEREATSHKKEGSEGKVKDIKQDTYTEIRNLWTDLEKIWKRKCAADSILVRRAREQGMVVYAVPKKKQGGGAHNPNRYRLALSPLPPETVDSDVSSTIRSRVLRQPSGQVLLNIRPIRSRFRPGCNGSRPMGCERAVRSEPSSLPCFRSAGRHLQ